MIEGIETSRLRAELAVMSIYRDQNKGIGESLGLGQLETAWTEYGLRAADLPRALDALLHRRLLAYEPGTVPHRIELTSMGAAWLDRQPAWLEYQLMSRRRQARFLHEFGTRRVAMAGRRRRTDAGAQQARRG